MSPAMDELRTKIDTVFAAIIALLPLLAEFELADSRARQSAGARLFDTAPDMVAALAHAMKSGVFPEIKDDPADLLEMQEIATSIRELWCVMLYLEQLSRDGYLLCQNAAIVDAFDVLRRMAAQDELVDETAWRMRQLALACTLSNLPVQGTKRGVPDAYPRYRGPKPRRSRRKLRIAKRLRRRG